MKIMTAAGAGAGAGAVAAAMTFFDCVPNQVPWLLSKQFDHAKHAAQRWLQCGGR